MTSAFTWPRHEHEPLRFVAQIDLASVPDVGLPREGSLVFFADTEARHRAGVGRVEWLRPKHGPVRPCAVPRGARRSPLMALDFESVPTLPHIMHEALTETRMRMSDEEIEAYGAVYGAHVGANEQGASVVHQLGGNPKEVQTDPRVELQLAAIGADPRHLHDPIAALELARGWDGWSLLLQVDSDRESRFSWGDSGSLYFYIEQHDLAAGRFLGTRMYWASH